MSTLNGSSPLFLPGEWARPGGTARDSTGTLNSWLHLRSAEECPCPLSLVLVLRVLRPRDQSRSDPTWPLVASPPLDTGLSL